MLESFIDLITRASLRFKWVTIGLSILALVAGIFALAQFNQELLPKIEFPQSVILVFNPGTSTEDMLEQVTLPIEDAVSEIDAVVNVETTTTSGVSVTVLRNEFGVDQDALREEIQSALDNIDFPEGMETPRLLTFSFSDLPIAVMSVSAPGRSLEELKVLVEAEVFPALETIDGIASVEVSGGQELPTAPPPTAEPTEEPEPTPEPTATPTEVPATPTEEVTAGGVPLPDSWITTAATQNVTIATTDDLTPEFIQGIAGFTPQMFDDLTFEMLQAMPLDALAALPEDYVLSLDPEIQTMIAERLAEPEPVPLPDSWIQGAAAMNLTLATTDDLTPEVIGGISTFAPQLLADLTPEMLEAMPLEALAALPVDYVLSLDPETQVMVAERLAELQDEPTPVPLPDSWIQAAALQNVTIETTADLSPEMVGAIASFMPQMLNDLTPEMLLAMPAAALAELPESYLQSLDPELQAQLAERIATAPVTEDEGALPSTWKLAGQTQGLTLEYPEDVTVEIFVGIANFAPQMLQDLTADNMRRFSPEVLGYFPEDFIQSLEPELREELEVLAEPVGGLGALAAETEQPPTDAPELSGLWREEPEEGAVAGPMPTIETAADLMNTGLVPTAAELLNLLVQSGQEMAPQLMADLTPEVVLWLAENEEGFLENLSPATLRLLSPEVLSSLPESYMESLDPELQAELEGIASGEAEAFIPTDTVNRVNGNPSLALMVFKDTEANTISVSDAVFEELELLEAEYEDLRFDVVFEQASFIEESITGVAREGALGAVFAVIVILIFLSGRVGGKYKLSWRSTLVTAVSIPLSVFMAFALLQWLPPVVNGLLSPLADATSNIPVLGGLLAAFLRLFPLSFSLNIMTLSGMTVAIGRVVDDSIVVLENSYRHIQRGEDLKSSVLIGTRDVAIAILASTVTTVVVFLPMGMLGGLVGEFFLPFGVTVTYALMSSFLVAVTIVPLLAYMFIRKEHLPEEHETTLQRTYSPILNWALNHRGLTLLIAAILFIGSMFLMTQLPRAFLPEMGEVTVTVSVDLPNGMTMSETSEYVSEFEAVLVDVDGLGIVQSEIGSGGGLASRILGGSIDQSAASIQIGLEDTSDLDALTAEIRQLAEDTFGSEYVLVSSGTMTSSAFGAFSIVLSGDPEELAAHNDDVIAALEAVDGLANVSSNLTETDMILRVDGQSAVSYTGELESENSLGVTEEAKTAVEAVVSVDITVSEGFETQQQTEGFQMASRAILISIIAVYVVMVITFRSFVHPFTILFSLPLALIGAVVALWLTDKVVGISALVGMMMLVGIVVTNAIVLIDRVQANRKKRDMNTRDALMEGGKTRLRPILMTAIAAMLALLPLALGLSEGAIVASDLATVVIGGLFTSTLLTLLVVPVMYSLMSRLALRRRKAAEGEEEAEGEN
ncbi:MAG: MMPL family transporter [Anaerolineales bacterium]|nr:MMPL family transporter [Anaerolineales bacterium]